MIETDLLDNFSIDQTTPDRKNFINPFNHRGWLGYFANLLPRFQYIRFLGLPSLKDVPDVLLEKLYVPLYMGDHYVSGPDVEAEKKISVQKVLEKHRRLVLLGDPGSGKSTLVNYLVMLFAAKRHHPFVPTLGSMIPVPFVLRDFKITHNMDFFDLIRQLTDQGFWPKTLSAQDLFDVMETGQAMIMLDGLDEIGDIEKRKTLKNIIINEGIEKFPLCVWMMTSRIIGYDEVPFDSQKQRFSYKKILSFLDKQSFFNIPKFLPEDERSLDRFYILPFGEKQIHNFIERWYLLREADNGIRKKNIKSLAQAIKASESIEKLAHTPNLLTLMALIHRVYAKLPSGRALLYDRITEAYLESIDEFRGIRETGVPMSQHRLWLASLAYEMQKERSSKNEDAEEILVAAEKVKQRMQEYTKKTIDTDKELSYIARRSGLLLPRKPGYYNFVHLSFQEFFASLYLYENLMGFDTRDETLKEIEILKEDLVWREAIVFLFEKLSDHTDASDWLFTKLFDPSSAISANSSLLLAELSGNLHSGISAKNRDMGSDILVRLISEQFDGELLERIDNYPKESFQERFLPAVERFLSAKAKTNTNANAKTGRENSQMP